ncbi:hypothetical protein J5N97_003778 [Dioscorea zingiberensis]|uniref:Arabidopsis retrotransposon Orf1 C-terminal domain-containing protein n=1 Tax=Dioscorea zingiberensis TaxID=325984 RepID=A0A9D5D6R8_9LILI|nr:hypothetical protein J5N97_003778 [Dioscorea zingiberensis]
MPRKVVASKKRRTGEGSSTTPQFEDDRFFHRYQKLAAKPFGRTRYIDWGVATELGIADRVQSMLGVGGWDKVFSINHETFREVTLEVLSTFEAERSSVQERSLTAISLQLLKERRTMSYTRFAMLMGFYDRKALHTRELRELLTTFPDHIIMAARNWVQLGGCHENHKASLMFNPVHRFIHALVSRSISGRDDSTGVVTVTDLFILYSILERVPIHLGYVFVDYLVHQGTHTRLRTITAGPYITCLIIGMGLEEKTEDMERLQLLAALGMSTLCQMGRVRHAGGRYRLVGQSVDSSGDEESDSEDSDSPSPTDELPPSKSQSRVAHLEEQIADIRATQDTMLTEQRRLGDQFTELSIFIRGHPAFAPPPPVDNPAL